MQNINLPKGITYQQGRAKPFLVRFQDRPSGIKFLDSFADLADAEKALEAVKKRAAECKETAEAADRFPAEIPKSETPLSVLAAEWWSHFRESLATSTRESYRLILEDHILPYFGECRLRDVTREMVIAFIARQRSLITQFHSRPSEKSILNRLGVLSAFLDEMLAQGLVAENAVQLARKAEFSRHKQRLMKTQQTDKLRKKVLTNEEAKRLLLAANDSFATGKNVHDLQRLLGHAHIQTTEKYLHAQGHTPYGVTDALAWTCSVGVDAQKTDNVRRLDLRPAQKNRSGIEHLGVQTERQDFSENMPSVQSSKRRVQRFKPSSVALNEET